MWAKLARSETFVALPGSCETPSGANPRMSSPERADCHLCRSVALPLKGGSVVRWERQDTPELHYMATAPAMRRRQWANGDRVAHLSAQIEAITAKGRVAWIEHLGDRNHLHVRIGETEVVTLADPDAGLNVGDDVAIEVVRPLYFDESGDRVKA